MNIIEHLTCASKIFKMLHTCSYILHRFFIILMDQVDVPGPPGAVLLGLGGVNRLVHAAKDVRGHVNHPPLPDGTTSRYSWGCNKSQDFAQKHLVNFGIF